MDIIEAQRIIQAEAVGLTAAFNAKGYEKARVSIWLSHGAHAVTIFIDKVPVEFGGFLYGDDIAAQVSKAHEMIAALPDARAYDADFAGPLVLMSDRPVAQAAE